MRAWGLILRLEVCFDGGTEVLCKLIEFLEFGLGRGPREIIFGGIAAYAASVEEIGVVRRVLWQ